MKTWIIIGILMATIGGAAYFYYSSSQSRIESLMSANATLAANNQAIQDANDANLRTIDELQAAYIEVQKNYDQVQNEFQTIRSQNAVLQQKLDKHEIGALAVAKPDLIETIINKASNNALRCFELSSGAPLTDAERSATNEKMFNTECPWLYNELVRP